MFACCDLVRCGTPWHEDETAAACAMVPNPPAIGDASAAAALNEGSSGVSDPARATFAVVVHRRDGEARRSSMTVRSLDDIFDVSVTHTLSGAVVTIAGNRDRAPHHLVVHADTGVAPADTLPSERWNGVRWLPGAFHVMGGPHLGAVTMRARVLPATADNEAEAAMLYGDPKNWTYESESGVNLGPVIHAVCASLRKAFVAALLVQMSGSVARQSSDEPFAVSRALETYRKLSEVSRALGVVPKMQEAR